MKRRNAADWLICLISAAAILMLCSMNSWLYPLNPWDDVNCFVTVAREILRGAVPYRDIMEQKGPLLYALHVLALLPDVHSYHGIYVMEVLLMTVTLRCMLGVLRLYRPRASAGWAAVMAAFICMSETFRMGDSAEQLCMAPMAVSLLAMLRHLRGERELAGRDFVFHGAMAGCILWMKYSVLGLHFAWMAFIALETAFAKRRPARAAGMCGLFLGGMALTGLPWFAFFAAKGALDDFLGAYFLQNMGSYMQHRYGVLAYMGAGLLRGLSDLRISVPLLLGLAGVVVMSRRLISVHEKVFLVFAAASMALMIYGGGRRYLYYFLPFTVLLPFAGLPLGRLWDLAAARLTPPARLRPAATALLVAAACLLAYWQSGNTRWIGYPYEQTSQGQAVALVGDEEGRTLLNVGSLDLGYYQALNCRPADRWFVLLNVHEEETGERHRQLIADGVPDLVVCNAGMLEAYGDWDYDLVAALDSPFSGRTTYLYRRSAEASDH